MSPATSRAYTTCAAARLTGTTLRKFDYWVRQGLLRPEKGKRGYVFREGDLRMARVVQALRERKCPYATIWCAFSRLEDGATGYLAVFSGGRRVVYCADGASLLGLAKMAAGPLTVVEMPAGAV